MKSIWFFFLICLAAGCSFKRKDTERGPHPRSAGGVNTVTSVNSHFSSGFGKSFCISKTSYPWWCDQDPDIRNFNSVIGTALRKGRHFKNAQVILNCVHDQSKTTQEAPACGDTVSEEPDFNISDEIFISASKSRAGYGVLALFFENTGGLFFQLYYLMYNSLCLNSISHCCMSSYGDFSVFYLTIPSGEKAAILKNYMESVAEIIHTEKPVEEEAMASGFNTFLCGFTDNCDYNSWYYSSLAQDITEPQLYMNATRWKTKQITKEMKRIKISKAGYSVTYADPAAQQEIMLVLKTILTPDETAPYKSPR